MKVLDIKTKNTIEVNDSYGARLIEQGKAVLPTAVGKATQIVKEKQARKVEA